MSENLTAPPAPGDTNPAPETAAPPATPGEQPGGPPAEPDYKALYEQATAKLTTAETAARENSEKAKRLDEIEAANKTEAERANDRATAVEKQLATIRRFAVDAEIRAAATGWADPTDAPRYLDDRDRYISEDGTVDTAAITADL
ncbi:hypothetical protein FXN61_35330, partial [Lentzea sp. PSKA42]